MEEQHLTNCTKFHKIKVTNLISGKVQNVTFFFILNPNASVFKLLLYQMTYCEWEQDNTPNFLSDTAQCLINSLYNCLLFLLL